MASLDLGGQRHEFSRASVRSGEGRRYAQDADEPGRGAQALARGPRKGEMRVAGGYYDLHTGKVEMV